MQCFYRKRQEYNDSNAIGGCIRKSHIAAVEGDIVNNGQLALCNRIQSQATIKMQRSEIRQALKKKGVGKLDGFLVKKSVKKEGEGDLMNMLQTWVHHLLYSKNIYPKQAFQARQVLGITVYVALSPPLREYLDGFFAKIKSHIDRINHIQIVFYKPNDQLIEVNTAHIQNLERKQGSSNEGQVQGGNLLQKQIQFKQFLNNLKTQLQVGYRRSQKEEVSFKLRVGYRFEGGQKDSRSMLDGWVARSKLPEEGGQIIGHLISPHLNLIFERGN